MARLATLLVVSLLMLGLAPGVAAGPEPSVKLSTSQDFARPPAGTTVSYKILFDATAADGQSTMDLELTYRNSDPKAVAWDASMSLKRVQPGTVVNLPTLSGFDAPVVYRGLFEGQHELTVTVKTSDAVGDYVSFIEFAVVKADGSGRTMAGPFRFDYQLQKAPDADNDGLSDARETELGTNKAHPDTDGDGLSDCQEVKHRDRGQCELASFNGPYDGGYKTDPKKVDTDGDGLRDDVEARSATDPTKADTDGDGLNDCQETRHTKKEECGTVVPGDGGYKTDPLVADEDGDGLMEGDEVRLKSDLFNKDTDGDGLTDGEEGHGTLNTAYNKEATDPTKKDTDGDGLSDFDEITVHGTNPKKTDTDGDKLLDGDEVAGPNSPLKADSDDDGLNDFDERMVHKTNAGKADTDGDGLSDGAEVNTHKTRPLDPDSDQDTVSDGDEVNVHKTNPLNHDSDGDGIHDGRELDEYGTDPAHFDTDKDGLHDGEEVTNWKTDPTLPDTDGDSLNDGAEVAAGSDPFRADTDGDGWNDGQEVRYGGNALDFNVRPSDVDDDKLADLEDPDADGDGTDDGEQVRQASQRLTDTLRLERPLHMRDEAGGLQVAFTVEPGDDVDGHYLWRGVDGQWTRVADGGSGTISDPDGRDGAQYRITAYRTIGAKTAGGGNATDVPGFDSLAPWELYVTSARVVGDQIVLRAGEGGHTFQIVAGGKTHTFDVAERTQQTVELSDVLAGVDGRYTVAWVDGTDSFVLEEGKLGGGLNAMVWGLAAGGLLLVGGAVAAVVIVRKRRAP